MVHYIVGVKVKKDILNKLDHIRSIGSILVYLGQDAAPVPSRKLSAKLESDVCYNVSESKLASFLKVLGNKRRMSAIEKIVVVSNDYSYKP